MLMQRLSTWLVQSDDVRPAVQAPLHGRGDLGLSPYACCGSARPVTVLVVHSRAQAFT